MGSHSLRQQITYLDRDNPLGGDVFFQSLLEEAKNCFPDGTPYTKQQARVLVKVLDEVREEVMVEVIQRFGTTGFGAREAAIRVARATRASRAAGQLEGRFGLDVRKRE